MARYPGIKPQGALIPSVIFHVSFVLFGTMIMLNLFIGVIMTGMQEAQEETAKMNRADKGSGSKFGDYSALVEEMSNLEDQVRSLKNKLADTSAGERRE